MKTLLFATLVTIVFVSFIAIVVVVRRWIRSHKEKDESGGMRFDNLEDIKKLIGGTVRFTFRGIDYEGVISLIEYMPLGPGVIRTELFSLQPVGNGPAVPDVPLWFTFSLFMTEVKSMPGGMTVNQLVPEGGYGNLLVFRVKEMEKT